MKQINDAGTYFPLWSTCLGFELLIRMEADDLPFDRCNETDVTRSLGFLWDEGETRRQSRIFRDVSPTTFAHMRDQQVAYHFHRWCITRQAFEDAKLSDKFKVISANSDAKGSAYVNVIESVKYPNYAVQFHPEKPAFEFVYQDGHR